MSFAFSSARYALLALGAGLAASQAQAAPETARAPLTYSQAREALEGRPAPLSPAPRKARTARRAAPVTVASAAPVEPCGPAVRSAGATVRKVYQFSGADPLPGYYYYRGMGRGHMVEPSYVSGSRIIGVERASARPAQSVRGFEVLNPPLPYGRSY